MEWGIMKRLCGSHFGLWTDKPERITCKRCLRILSKKNIEGNNAKEKKRERE